MTETELEHLLRDHWSREYGWSPIVRTGSTCPMQAIADYHGKAPMVTGFKPQTPLGTIADDVEAAVQRLKDVYFLGFLLLRCEYLGRMDRPAEAKLYQMAGWGFRMDRETYEEGLRSAKRVLVEVIEAATPVGRLSALTAA